MSISLDEILLAKRLWWKGGSGGGGGGGGGDISVQPLSVTENGTYTAESGKAYSPVTVNVPTGGGSEGSPLDDVALYDYDGSVIASYTAAEFDALTSMPIAPSHEGLTAQGWNWSLENAKQYVRKYGKLNMGQMYITDDGKTRIYIHLEKGRLAPYLGIAINGTATVEWGDGDTDTVTGTSTMTVENVRHIYAAPGDYIIKIAVTGAMTIIGSSGTGSQLLWTNSTTTANNRCYQGAIKKIEIGSNVDFTDYALDNCYGLESITIPYGITETGTYAFRYCHGLKSITIPNSVTTIGASAFANCYSTESISIPDGVTTIGTSAFSGCYGITSITIPDGVDEISNTIFSTCCNLRSVIIPDSVTTIFSSAFQSCYTLTSITIPDSVTTIGSSAFSNCYGIESITIPDGVTNINSNTFNGCRILKSITIPDSVTTIGSSAFDGCYSLATITFPDGVTAIGTYALRFCYSIESITIPDSVTIIDSNTFAGCYGITSITIPDSVTTIGNSAFSGCSGIGEMHFLSTTPPTVSNRNAFSNIPTDCIIYVPAGSLAAYTSATNYPNSTTYQYVEY